MTLWEEDLHKSLSIAVLDTIFWGSSLNLIEPILPVHHECNLFTQFKLQGVTKLGRLAILLSTLASYTTFVTATALPTAFTTIAILT